MPIIKAGGIDFETTHVSFGDDGGPRLTIYGQILGQRVQVLRFDCFKDAPQYHLDPDGQDEVFFLDAQDDAIDWTIVQVRERLDTLFRRAGFPTLAVEVDMAAVRMMSDIMETVMRTTGIHLLKI